MRPAGLQHLTGEASLADVAEKHRFYRRVFIAPPWPELYVTDPERRHGLDTAVAEYERLIEVYLSLDYEVAVLPKVSVSERADFVLSRLC